MKKLWLYTLAVPDGAETVASVKTMLKDKVFDANAYMEIIKFDSKCRIAGWATKSMENNKTIYSTVSTATSSEADVLAQLWEELNLLSPMVTIAGWRLLDIGWPRLINKSLSLGLEVPAQFRMMSMNPMKKFSDMSFYDLYNVYKQGSYTRPEVSMSEQLTRWTGQTCLPEHVLAATVMIGGSINMHAEMDRYLTLMCLVSSRYDVVV